MEEARVVNRIEVNLPQEKQALLMQPIQRKQITGEGLHQEVKMKMKESN